MSDDFMMRYLIPAAFIWIALIVIGAIVFAAIILSPVFWVMLPPGFVMLALGVMNLGRDI